MCKSDSITLFEMYNGLPSQIFSFFGQDPAPVEHGEHVEKNYILVLEYANQGNLRNYLKSNFQDMDWNTKLKFSKQILSAVVHLHNNDIVHRDLVCIKAAEYIYIY